MNRNNYTCLVCNERLRGREKTSFASPEYAKILVKLFTQFYEQMEIGPNGFQYDFSGNIFPFCKNCRMFPVRLDKLKLQRTQGQQKCSRLAMTLAKAWRRIPFAVAGDEVKEEEEVDEVSAEIQTDGKLFSEEDDYPHLKEDKGRAAIVDDVDGTSEHVDDASGYLSLPGKRTPRRSARSLLSRMSNPEVHKGRQLRPRKIVERVAKAVEHKVMSSSSREILENENDSFLGKSTYKTESESTGSSESESETESGGGPISFVKTNPLHLNLDKKYPFSLLPSVIRKGNVPPCLMDMNPDSDPDSLIAVYELGLEGATEKRDEADRLCELDLGTISRLAKSDCSNPNPSFDVSQEGNNMDEDKGSIIEDGSDEEDAIAFRYDNIYPFTLLQTEFGDSGIQKQTGILYITTAKFRYLRKFVVEHVSEGYKCCTCNTVFPSQGTVLSHVRLRHQQNKKPSDNIWLRETSPNRFQYGEFEAEKVNDEFSCKSCDFVTKKKTNMRKHLRSKHFLTVRPECYKPLKEICEFCGKSFTNGKNLRLHQYVHANTAGFKCSICEKSFRTPGGLSSHKKTKHNEGRCTANYTCEFCGRSFKCRTTLANHLTQHTGVKPFDCKDCSKKFSTATALATHRNHHTGKIKYECDICGMKFTQSYSITRHKKVVHKVAPQQTKTKRKTV